MAKRMLIDASQPDETRVAVVSGNRLEDYDFETATKKQLKGNIYLAKVVRVEPSLQAAFVDYGGNRHGFLAFSEIHPDYYKIPVEDRDALLAEEREMAEERMEDLGGEAQPSTAEAPRPARLEEAESASGEGVTVIEDETAFEEAGGGGDEAAPGSEAGEAGAAEPEALAPEGAMEAPEFGGEALMPAAEAAPEEDVAEADVVAGGTEPWPETEGAGDGSGGAPEDEAAEAPPLHMEGAGMAPAEAESGAAGETMPAEARQEAREAVETVGGDDEVEYARRRHPSRRYKIQEVIKRRQVMLVQVTKEERGTKGAALTTRLSLAGRYCVLMPNTGRGGGISRKISSAQDRKRLRDIIEGIEIPEGISVIVRTAGASRNKAEIKRDFDYLLRTWNDIRELTLKSTAPALIYEEANLIKRSIRDLYSRDMENVLVEGEEGYKLAKEFMKTLMPSHARRVQPYRSATVPLFQRFGIESQIVGIHQPLVRLKSGGYIVINQTEALVAVDVNSGKATRERNIEETALKTNLEAADEIARQLRLRDLAGLIVIDFIDMESQRNQRAVEKRLKDAMRHDRARIQLGRISHFGLLELSRQRLRPSLHEFSTERCAFCQGTGFVRSTESTAVEVLRAVEEEGLKSKSAEIALFVPPRVALYILNQKRPMLTAIEERHRFRVMVSEDEVLVPPNFRIEVTRTRTAAEAAALEAAREADTLGEIAPVAEEEIEAAEKLEELEELQEEAAEAPAAKAPEPAGAPGVGEPRGGKRRRRGKRGGRRRRGRGGERPAEGQAPAAGAPAEPGGGARREQRAEPEGAPGGGEQPRSGKEDERGGRRRGRRGRRRGRGGNGQSRGEGAAPAEAPAAGAEPAEAAAWTPPPEQPEPRARPPVSEPQMAPAEGQAEAARPKRRGWWQRLTE